MSFSRRDVGLMKPRKCRNVKGTFESRLDMKCSRRDVTQFVSFNSRQRRDVSTSHCDVKTCCLDFSNFLLFSLTLF